MRNQIAAVATLTAACWISAANAQPAKPEAAKPPAEGAAAPEKAPMGPPKPAPENDVIKKSVGSWTCEGSGKGPDGQEHKYKSTWTVKPTLGGHWFTVVYKRAKMGPLPPFEGNASVGFNTAEKKYVFVGFDNLGGWINLSSTDGAAYTGQGAPMGKTGPVKFTFNPGKDKKGEESDKAFDAVLDFGVGGSTESCKK